MRSSATTEDAADASFAGLQDTYLWVTSLAQDVAKSAQLLGQPVFGGVRQLSPQAGLAGSRLSPWPWSCRRMVDARTAGRDVHAQSADRRPLGHHHRGRLGLGSAVVGGEVTPDRWVVGKITGEISVREISDKHIQHVPAARRGDRERGGAGASAQTRRA